MKQTSIEQAGGTDYGWLPAGFAVREVEANGIRISSAVGGGGSPLVLLHGWPQTGRIWRHVMTRLAERHTVVVPDLRGAGASERPEGGYSKIDQADDMRALLKALQLDGPSVVVGHDIGAMVATAWALKSPQEVAALVVLDAILPGMGLEEFMNPAQGGMFHFGLFMTPHIPEMLFAGHELEFMTWAFRALSGTRDAFSDADIAFYAHAYTGADRLRGGFAQYRTLLDDGKDNRELLKRPLSMPVLAMGGAQSTGTSLADGLGPHAPRLSRAVAPTGHFIAEEAPDWFVDKLNGFLASWKDAPADKPFSAADPR